MRLFNLGSFMLDTSRTGVLRDFWCGKLLE